MPRRKSSSGGGSRESQQKGQGAQEQGGIPTVPGASEGACGQSSTTSTSEDARHADQPQHTEGHEEADGGGLSQATVGRKMSKKERKEAERERKDAKRQQEKERKEREKREKEYKKMEKQKIRGSSEKRNSSSESAQPPTSPNELHVPQPHPTPSEGSRGSQDLTSAQGATALEEGAKQTSEEARGDDMQTGAVDDTVFVEADMRQAVASKSQQDEKDKRIAELEELLTKQLEDTKSDRIQKLEREIEILQEMEVEMNTQHNKHIKDLQEALERKHDEIESLSDKHATQILEMRDDHSKKILQLHQEREQSEREKDEEAIKLQQALHEKEKESEEKMQLLQRKSVQLKEELETKLKEKEEQLCALPLKHYLEEINKQKEEQERKHALELSQLQAAVKEKEKLEEESRGEADNLCRELKAANEEHAKNVGQLRELKQKEEQEADKLRRKLADADKRREDELRQLQSTLREKSEQELNKLHSELEELTAKNAEEVQQLKAELREKDERYTKAITEYEDKHKIEQHQKITAVEKKAKRQDIVGSGLLRDMKNEIEQWKKACEEKDGALVGLKKELEKMKEENQQKYHEMEKHVEVMKAETEKLQHEQRKQHVAEASTMKKEHNHLLESQKQEIELLRKQLHQVYEKLNAGKETPEMQKLQEQLQEKDHKLNTVVTELKTLRNSYEELVANHEHLKHQYGQLTVEVTMKKELSESNELVSSSDPCDTTVIVKPQVVLRGSVDGPSMEPDESKAGPGCKEGRTTHLEKRVDGILLDMQTIAAENKKLRDEVSQLKRADKQQFVAVTTSSSQESPAVRDRSRSPSPVAVIKPMTQSPKPQPPYRRQASAGPIMVHAIPPVQNTSPSLPHAYYHNNQQQQINFMDNVKIREDTYVTDNPRTIKYKYKSDARNEEDEHDDRPFDPNLVCAACSKQFRIGEIQEFRKHYKSCKKKEIKEETTDLDPPRHNIIMAGDTQPFTPILPSTESDQDLVSSTSEPKHLCRTPGCSFKGYEHLGGYCSGCSGQGTIHDDQY